MVPRNGVAADLKTIYSAATREEAKLKLKEKAVKERDACALPDGGLPVLRFHVASVSHHF